MENKNDKRLPKQFGDFAELLVMFVLGKYKKMRVALVDHVGADLIATDRNNKFAISVKGRNIPDNESKSYVFNEHNIEELKDFSKSFNLIPCVAFVFVDTMEEKEKIRMFILTLDSFEKMAKNKKITFINKTKKNEYSFNYLKGVKINHLEEIKNNDLISYTEFAIEELKDITDDSIESDKIYNYSDKKQQEIFEHNTCIYKELNKKEIKQILSDYYNNIYVLTNKGVLYKTSQDRNDLDYLCDSVEKIHILDGLNLYKITNENVILPIDNNKKWNNTDKYLNNNNCKYKKIEMSLMHIVLLTGDGRVRALCGGYPNLGIIPENFMDVEDIKIVDKDGMDTPYIKKNNKFVELYIN